MSRTVYLLILFVMLFAVGCGERNPAEIPGPFHLLGSYQTRGWAFDVAVGDTVAVVAQDDAGAAILDIRNPAAIDTFYNLPTAGYNYRVTLCVLSVENGVFGPYNPTTGGPPLYNLATGAYANGGFRNSSEVYKMVLLSRPDTLQLFVGDRTASDGFASFTLAKTGDHWDEIDFIESYNAGGNKIYGFALSGDLAALCFDELGILIRNWRTSQNVIWVDTPGGAHDAVWVGDYIYVADYGNGVQVIDATTPASAHIVASVMPQGSSRLDRIAAENGYLFVLDSNDGIYVIDISTPNAPQYLQLLETPAPNGVTAYGGKVYVADSYRGLLVYGM
jgi:hypothetical protein